MASKRVGPGQPVPDAGGGGDKSVLKRCIIGFYTRAIERLPVEEKPALLAAILDGGLCFGPLDPVSNIVANAIWHLSTGEDSSEHVEEVEMRQCLKTMARGSLKALVGFMTSYFRYLPTMEAMHFLRAAEGDLLAAVHLVEAERCTSAFDIGSCTTKTALRCAAGASGHPDPDRLATAMLSLSSKAHKIAHLLSRKGRLTCSDVDHLSYLLLEEGTNDQICTQQLMALVPPRLPPELADAAATFSPLAPQGVTVKDERTLERCTKSLQCVLVDKIHGFYLEALALLPQHLLRGRYHRSVVMAGHCYGPLDPVSNIILNTIWYDAAFPVPKEQHLDLDMIGRWALVRAERYSVAGLVAGLIAFAGDYNLSELQAIRCLLYANGDFATAMSVLQQALLNQERTMLSDSELCRFMDVMAKRLQLYSVMAIAAQHPSADGLQEFLISERTRAMLPMEYRRFSREDVHSVIESLLHEPPPSLGMPPELVRLSLAAERTIDQFPDATKRFWADMSSFHSKAKAALESYVLENGKVRCFYCEYKGINIIHPADGNYHGCDTDFEKMARRKHVLTNSIESVFNNGLLVSNFRGAVQEDFFYFDHARDHAKGPSSCSDG
ncbi:hypothetical protein OsJ_31248 [Oryza sativa Japonica Group]|uniref:PIR2-like helical domain-containing protein n=1 Tax=Oryza sativa subsp. japonica TaxID=39947 RepID=A3C416_ORYSJ|nr:hypothetical protein OsJ_31248 [Oryza sativa Japonica Group]